MSMFKPGLISVVAVTLSIGCSEDAVVGGDSDPITCVGQRGAEVDGTLAGAEFGAVGSVFYDDSDGPGIINIGGGLDQTNTLQFVFSCGPAVEDAYSITRGSDNQLPELCDGGAALVTAAFFGSDQTATSATDGTVVVDEFGTCIGGRFSISFDGDVLQGWFAADASPN